MVVRKKILKKKKEEFYLPQLPPVEIKREEAAECAEFTYALPQTEVEPEPAQWWRRAVAFVIDTLLVYFIFFQIFVMVYMPMAGIPMVSDFTALQNYASTNKAVFLKMVVGVAVFPFIYLFYLMLCEINFKTTFGKRLLSLKTVSLEGELTYWQAFLRNVTKTILFPFLVFDLVPAIFTANRQRFFEVISGTKVIYYPKLKLVYEGEY